MSKKNTYHAPFFDNFIESRLSGMPIAFGFLVGTKLRDGQRDIVYAAPTPPQPTEEGEEETPKDIVAILKAKGSMQKSFIKWANQYQLALRKLLPGNVEPCGCFIAASESVAKDLAPTLAPLMKSIGQPILLTLDGKLTFWNYAVEGAKVTLRPAQLKQDTHKDAVLVWTTMLVDLVAPRSPEAEDDTDGRLEGFSKAAETSVDTYIKECIVGVSANESPLSIVNLSSESPLGGVAPKGCNELRVAFMQNGPSLIHAPNPDGLPCFRQRCIVVASVLFVRRDIELREVVEELREAVVSSTGARVQLVLEESESIMGRLDMPWRALCRPRDVDLPLWCGDYCMPDEGIEMAQSRLAELLGHNDFEAASDNLDEYKLLQQHFPSSYKPAAAPQARPNANTSGSSVFGFCCKRRD